MNRTVRCITTEEQKSIQECLLKMLKDVIFVCEKYNIAYMLGGGSALGAVRHSGFIPWDDDLDITMPRDDYERFIEVMYDELGDYYDFSYPNSKRVDYPYMKIYKKDTKFVELLDDMSYEGIWIDVFPIDYAPNNKWARKIKGCISDVLFHGIAASLMIYQKKSKETKHLFKKSLQKKIRYYFAIFIGNVLFFLSYKDAVSIFDSFVHSKTKTRVMTVPTGRAHYLGECLPANYIFPTRKLKFCDIEVNVYKNVEAYLSQLYGDYMEIPPLQKREKHYISEFYISKNIQFKLENLFENK